MDPRSGTADAWHALGLPPTASVAEAERAYRRLAKHHHPDRVGDDPAARQRAAHRMASLNAAIAAVRRGQGAVASVPDVAARPPVPCPRCGATFTRADDLRAHLWDAHTGRWSRRRRRGGPALDRLAAVAWRTPLWYLSALGVLASLAATWWVLDVAPGREAVDRLLPPADMAPRALGLGLLVLGQVPVLATWMLAERHRHRLEGARVGR